MHDRCTDQIAVATSMSLELVRPKYIDHIVGSIYTRSSLSFIPHPLEPFFLFVKFTLPEPPLPF